jgi:hypothetical protein
MASIYVHEGRDKGIPVYAIKVCMNKVIVQLNLYLGTSQPYAVAALPPGKEHPAFIRIFMGLGNSLDAL